MLMLLALFFPLISTIWVQYKVSKGKVNKNANIAPFTLVSEHVMSMGDARIWGQRGGGRDKAHGGMSIGYIKGIFENPLLK